MEILSSIEILKDFFEIKEDVADPLERVKLTEILIFVQNFETNIYDF